MEQSTENSSIQTYRRRTIVKQKKTIDKTKLLSLIAENVSSLAQVVIEGETFTKKQLDDIIQEAVLQELNEPLGYDIGEKTVKVVVNDEEFECIRTQDEKDKRKGTLGYIVYDEYANLLGKFNYVRSLEELEYLIEKKLQNLETKPILSATDMETCRRRGIQNPHMYENY